MFTIFAAFKARTYIHILFLSSYFYCYLNADTRLSIHSGLLRIRCSLFLPERGKIAFPILKVLIFHYMARTMEDYSSVNNSTATVTSAHDTCTLRRKKIDSQSALTILRHFYIECRKELKKNETIDTSYRMEETACSLHFICDGFNLSFNVKEGDVV